MPAKRHDFEKHAKRDRRPLKLGQGGVDSLTVPDQLGQLA